MLLLGAGGGTLLGGAARRTRLPRTLWAILFFVVLVATLGFLSILLS